MCHYQVTGLNLNRTQHLVLAEHRTPKGVPGFYGARSRNIALLWSEDCCQLSALPRGATDCIQVRVQRKLLIASGLSYL